MAPLEIKRPRSFSNRTSLHPTPGTLPSAVARSTAAARRDDGRLAMLSGVRRGELFALRWRDLDEQDRTLAVREAVYEGRFDTPKTQAGFRQIALSDAALHLVADRRARIKEIDPDALVFSTWSGKRISPNNVLRRQVFPACEALGFKHVAWLTLRRTYSSWPHKKVCPAKSWLS